MDLIHRSPVAASPGSEADTECARVLAALLARVQRSLRRRVREMMPGPALPPSHVEVLRLLQRQPGLHVHEVAATLRLAPNTTSTIVKQQTGYYMAASSSSSVACSGCCWRAALRRW